MSLGVNSGVSPPTDYFQSFCQTFNRLPSSYALGARFANGRCLTSLRIQVFCPFILFRQNCTEGRQVLLSDTAIIHPVTNTTISDKASRGNHLVDNGKLFCRTSKLGFKYEQDQYRNILWDDFTIRRAITGFFCWSKFIWTLTRSGRVADQSLCSVIP